MGPRHAEVRAVALRPRESRSCPAFRAGIASLLVAVAACDASDRGDPLGSPGARPGEPSAAETAVRGSPPVVVRASPGLEGVAARIASDPAAWRSFPGLGEPGRWLADTVALYVVRDLAELSEEGLARAERWVAGTADPAGRRIALRAGSELEPLSSLRAVFRHELAHLLVHAAAGGRAPRWLHEGYAQLASGAWSWGDAWRIQINLFRGGAGTLRDVDLRFRSNAEDVRLAYLLSYTVVQELWGAGGDAGLQAFFLALRSGATVDAALREVYGVTEEQFERRWRTSVMDRYGWLYLLSRAGVFWLLVTLLVLTVSLRRARSDRRRIADMRAQEALEGDVPGPWSVVEGEGPGGNGTERGPPGPPAVPEEPGTGDAFVDGERGQG
ncbi:MAG: peptidase MA family metallohydrolase [Gemmatimonadota bacterium]